MTAYRYRIATAARRWYPRVLFTRYESRTILGLYVGRYGYCIARLHDAAMSEKQAPDRARYDS